MKRYLAIFGILFIGVIAGLIVRGIPIVLQVQAGGGIQADRNGDVNGDARLDMSDAVYLLLHIFRDGPQPVAFAQAEPADLGQLEANTGRIADSLNNLVALGQERENPNLGGLEGSLESIAYNFDRFVAGQCDSSLDRFVWQENETVIDTCKHLMWADRDSGAELNYFESQEYVEGLDYAGYSDWRLPTLTELAGLIDKDERGLMDRRRNLPPFSLNGARIWSSTRNANVAWTVNFLLQAPRGDRSDDVWFTNAIYTLPLGDHAFGRINWVTRVLPVRDIGPNE